MAALIVRLLPFLARILRAATSFKLINTVQKVETILKREDIAKLKSIYENKRDFYKHLKKLLFNDNLKTHQYIFFSEKELREYIKKIDYNAKILKIVELKEVDLYIVEFNDIKMFFNKNKENILQYFSDFLHLSLITNFFNVFNTELIYAIQNADNELKKELKYIINSDKNNNDEFDFLNKLRSEFKNDIDSIINHYKSLDIANTYCVSCSCCCSCDEDSCCCSCNCSLVHYTQAYEDARAELKHKVDDYINKIKDRLNYDFLDTNNNKSYINFIDDTLINRKNNYSLIMLYFTNLTNLLFNLKEKQKAKLLFAVIKNVEVEKKKVMRALYKFIRENFYMQKIEKKKFLKILKEFFYNEFNRKVDDKYLQSLLRTFSKRYIKITKYKINNKEFYFIGWNGNKSK